MEGMNMFDISSMDSLGASLNSFHNADEVNELWDALNLNSLLKEVVPNQSFHNKLNQKHDPFEQRKKMLNNPAYSILMSRYNAKPREPKILTKKTLMRLSDPCQGKFCSPGREKSQLKKSLQQQRELLNNNNNNNSSTISSSMHNKSLETEINQESDFLFVNPKVHFDTKIDEKNVEKVEEEVDSNTFFLTEPKDIQQVTSSSPSPVEKIIDVRVNIDLGSLNAARNDSPTAIYSSRTRRYLREAIDKDRQIQLPSPKGSKFKEKFSNSNRNKPDFQITPLQKVVERSNKNVESRIRGNVRKSKSDAKISSASNNIRKVKSDTKILPSTLRKTPIVTRERKDVATKLGRNGVSSSKSHTELLKPDNSAKMLRSKSAKLPNIRESSLKKREVVKDENLKKASTTNLLKLPPKSPLLGKYEGNVSKYYNIRLKKQQQKARNESKVAKETSYLATKTKSSKPVVQRSNSDWTQKSTRERLNSYDKKSKVAEMKYEKQITKNLADKVISEDEYTSALFLVRAQKLTDQLNSVSQISSQYHILKDFDGYTSTHRKNLNREVDGGGSDGMIVKELSEEKEDDGLGNEEGKIEEEKMSIIV